MKPWLNLLVLLPSALLAASAPVPAVEVAFNFDTVASGAGHAKNEIVDHREPVLTHRPATPRACTPRVAG